ncbi:MAG: DEAD/DEAH box helicase [Oligoflexia bacterium]|nr:DEAD/DEAH box helicase [Oligoflexia bacterium]
MSSFASFNLLPSLQQTLNDKKYKVPTEIQVRAIPLLLDKQSVVGVAETGSGKTLAYALPILHMLKMLENEKNPVKIDGQPRALIIVPTRELGEQVAKVFKIFTHSTRLRVRTILGGTKMEVAKKNISGPFEILVVTPGRTIKLLDQRRLNLSDVRTLVFDEADQMLDEGFLSAAHKILEACTTKPQMALFSATVSDAVQELISELFSDVEVIRSGGSHRVPQSLTTVNRKVIDGKREPLLENLLKEKAKGGTIIFTNTREQCDKLALIIEGMGHKCTVYRGEMDKMERRNNLKSFREGKVDLLISTDLASRGLDLEHVGRIINYHLPREIENYLHRVGRTARAGRSGVVFNFVTERDEPLVLKIEKSKAIGSKN